MLSGFMGHPAMFRAQSLYAPLARREISPNAQDRASFPFPGHSRQLQAERSKRQ
jgi:hypothetical protein